MGIVKELECVRSTMIACFHSPQTLVETPHSFFLLHLPAMNELSFFALALIQSTCLGVDMATPVKIASSTSASKRARSQDSQCPSNNFPASGTTGIIQASYRPNIPAFLRQSRSGLFITERLCACSHCTR